MRKTKFLPKTPTCPVCMPHHEQGLQPITEHLATGFSQSVLKFWGKQRGLFSPVVDTVKRKNEGNSSSSWGATFVSVQQQQSSKAAKHNHGRLQAALYWKADAAIIVMWRNVFQPLFSFSGQFSLCFSAFAQAHFPFLKQASQRPSSVQLRASSVVTLPNRKLGKDEAAWTSFLSKTIRRPNDLSC